MSRVNLTKDDLFRSLRAVSRYETNGCWAGSTGNADGQLLSVGVMQWNFKQGSLQPLLKKFSEKFTTKAQYERIRDELMPKYGAQLLHVSCRTIPIQDACASFLQARQSHAKKILDADFKSELDALFNSPIMRQIQLDYFSRSMTSVLSDLERVFKVSNPQPWQVAWAIDTKTQQDKFPTTPNIEKIKAQGDLLSIQARLTRLSGVVKWYEGLCDSGTSEGIRLDCNFNINAWNSILHQQPLERQREEAIHFTFLVSRTARNQDGAYQANAFQRRATIVFGRGSVNGTKVDFTQ